jgi:hypothetical protein
MAMKTDGVPRSRPIDRMVQRTADVQIRLTGPVEPC